nr:glycosyltransferase family 4 protein [uncultured Pseudodesulfovibrio sp.]
MATQSPGLRVAFVLQDLEFGGTQRQTIELVTRMDRTRFDTELWALRSEGGFISRIQSSDVPLRILSSGNTVGLKSLCNLWRAIRNFRPDVIVPLTVVPNIWCRIFGRLASVPLILGTCRGGASIVRQHERFLWRLAHHHVCNASQLRETLISDLDVPSSQVTLIENGISSDDWTDNTFSKEGKNILCVGRLVEDKDHGTLLRAFAITMQDHQDARLTIVGDGHLKQNHRQLATLLGIADAVTFMPGQTDLTSLYAACDIFALSSSTEASPNVLMEAAAAGKPVVATNVGGIPRLILDQKTGLLIDRQSPEAMGQALSKLLTDTHLRREMGQAAQGHIKKSFGMKKMVRSYETLLQSLAARQVEE